MFINNKQKFQNSNIFLKKPSVDFVTNVVWILKRKNGHRETLKTGNSKDLNSIGY